MVNTYGQWTEEKDYNSWPESRWCMYDHMVDAIHKAGYEVKTTMENLIEMIISHAECNVEAGEKIDLDSCEDIMYWVNCSGGLQEFDYYC